MDNLCKANKCLRQVFWIAYGSTCTLVLGLSIWFLLIRYAFDENLSNIQKGEIKAYAPV